MPVFLCSWVNTSLIASLVIAFPAEIRCVLVWPFTDGQVLHAFTLFTWAIWIIWSRNIFVQQENRFTETHSLSLYISRSLSLYIYICCEVIIWSKFGGARGYYLVQVGVIMWSTFVCLSYFYSGVKRFLHTQLSFCVLCVRLSENSLFQKKRVQKLGFSIFSVLSLNFENSLF